MPIQQKNTYSVQSPYASAGVHKLGLDIMEHRSIPRYPEDELYEITAKYHLKPQRLAYDIYGTTELWWVFSARNPGILKDPLFNFVTGAKIFLPTKQTLSSALGI